MLVNIMQTVAVSEKEGDAWTSFEEWCIRRVPDRDGTRIHAVKFREEDGTEHVWDAYNGWRRYTVTERYARFPAA